MIYKKRKANTNADALSRILVCETRSICEIEERKVITKYIEKEKQQILFEYHSAPLGGHQGVDRTLNRIKQVHNWPEIVKDVKDYVSRCKKCQQNKLSRKTKMPLKITDTSSKPFEKCALDIVGPLTMTVSGNKYVSLTFQDDFTKFSKAIPILRKLPR